MSITPTATHNTLPFRTAKRRAGYRRGAILYLNYIYSDETNRKGKPEDGYCEAIMAGAMSKKTTHLLLTMACLT